MKNVVPVRKDLGVRTIFNILGPLTNPAKAPNILMGVFHPELVATQAKVLQLMGAEHALVVHGNDGLDEITLSGPTMVAELRNGQISQYELIPSDFGIATSSMESLKVTDAQESKAIILNIMNNQSGPARDVVCLNAGTTLYAANVSPSIAEGIALASSTIASGKAKQKLEAFVALTQSLAS
jgi:anthranilate phosphoribosyltransferase